jgi:hypothetical protein
MKTAYKEALYFINNRPLCFLTIVFALRDFIFGLGIVLGVPELMHTLLVQNLNELWSAGPIAIFIVVCSALTMVAAVFDWTKYTRFGLAVQSWTWLFVMFTYISNEQYWLAAIFGLMMSVSAGYISYYYKWASIWDAPKITWRERHGLRIK